MRSLMVRSVSQARYLLLGALTLLCGFQILIVGQAAEIQSTGLAPPDNRESAILMTLVPGNYTTIVRGVNKTTGIALAEAYKLTN